MSIIPDTQSRRRTIRIPSILPVDFQLLSGMHEPLDPEVRTGFTRDLGEGGLCLEITTLPERLGRILDGDTEKLRITADIRLPRRTLRIPGRVAWTEATKEKNRTVRRVGVEFLGLAGDDATVLAAYAERAAARAKKTRLTILALAALALIGLGTTAWIYNMHQSEIAEAQRALLAKGKDHTLAANELERLYVEVRWVATEVREMAEELRQAEGEARPTDAAAAEGEGWQPPLAGPAIVDLATNVTQLRQIVEALNQERPGGAKP